MYHKRERVPASFQGLHSIHQRTTTQPKNGAPFASIRATKRDKFVNTWKGWHILYLLLHFLERNRFSFNNLLTNTLYPIQSLSLPYKIYMDMLEENLLFFYFMPSFILFLQKRRWCTFFHYYYYSNFMKFMFFYLSFFATKNYPRNYSFYHFFITFKLISIIYSE